MTAARRKKNVRARGRTTHFLGSMKKGRGAGNRGGRGMAGSGKRADQKKPTILKLYGSSYFGKHGFKRPRKVVDKIKTINLGDLEEKEIGSKEKDFYIINLKEIGYDKLLGSGQVTRKYKITAAYCSNRAKEKIEKAGGEVICPSSEQS
tara:strand:- start:4673 stop:5119 length:447 start_codon:yes stop_codon:yes gene_type:complete